MSNSLYARLGGFEKIQQIANDIVDLHLANPVLAPRFAPADIPEVKRHARDFICAGTGGPETYEGRTMPDAHRGMNVNEQEFVATIDDVLEALEKNGVGQREQDEMLVILYRMKGDIVHL